MIALLGDRLRRRVLPEMERAFHYPTTHAEEFRILCQEPEARPAPRERRRAGVDEPGADFTLSVSLNAGEYRGGEWRFPEFGPELYAPPAGAALVFASTFVHEVLDVVAGRRIALATRQIGRAPV